MIDEMDNLLEHVHNISPNLEIKEPDIQYDLPDAEFLDFRGFIAEPKVPFNIIIANEKIGIQCHKNILQKISNVFHDLLAEGYPFMKILPLHDLTNVALTTLQKLIYAKPKNRCKIFQSLKILPNDLFSILFLLSKYNIVFMDPILTTYFRKTNTYNLNFIGKLWKELISQNLHHLAKILSEVNIQIATLDQQNPKILISMPVQVVEIIAKNLQPTNNISLSQKWFTHLIDFISHSKNQDTKKLKKILYQKLQNPDFLPPEEVTKMMFQLLETKIWSNEGVESTVIEKVEVINEDAKQEIKQIKKKHNQRHSFAHHRRRRNEFYSRESRNVEQNHTHNYSGQRANSQDIPNSRSEDINSNSEEDDKKRFTPSPLPNYRRRYIRRSSYDQRRREPQDHLYGRQRRNRFPNDQRRRNGRQNQCHSES